MKCFFKSLCYPFFALFFAWPLFALPKGEKVAAGQAEFVATDRTLQVTVADKAIINYQSFSIDEAEHVQFVQPTAKSSVLNRIVGTDPSQIMGRLSGNGRVFLINPNGICFGPKAVINTGSFLASTLNILDGDFLNDNFRFFQQEGSAKAEIVNEGMISSSPEGFVALFASGISNLGTIRASAGKVILAAAEKVTLDFSGDGLIQFSVDGDLKQALIENFGHIEAANGSVELTLRTAKDAIKMVVNTDGITPANAIEEVNGVIHLVSQSCITAKEVILDGGDYSRVEVEGAIDASTNAASEKGGVVHVLGDMVTLQGAQIQASGDAGGGEVLIGGDYQGQEPIHHAQITWVDERSKIAADARVAGDGGKVIVWSDVTTIFDGTISARGANGGNGGFVETSGKINLGVNTGKVDTFAPEGKFGEWLLDPSNVTIATEGTATYTDVSSGCTTSGSYIIDPATINGLTNVTICSQFGTSGTITVSSPIVMTVSGSTLTFTASSTSTSAITLGASITTNSGAITLNGPVILAGNIQIDTTNGGAVTKGANVIFASTLDSSDSSYYSLTVWGGTGGAVTFASTVGASGALGFIVVESMGLGSSVKSISLGGNITTNGHSIRLIGPITLATAVSIDSTNSGNVPTGADITFQGSMDGTTIGAQTLTANSGSVGNIQFSGTVGASVPLGAILISSPFSTNNLVEFDQSITAYSLRVANVTTYFGGAGTSTVNTHTLGGEIYFGGPLKGYSLGTVRLNSGSAALITFTNNVGVGGYFSSLYILSGSGGLSIGSAVTNISAYSMTVDSTVPTTLNNTNLLTIQSHDGTNEIEIDGTIDGATAGSQAVSFIPGSGAYLILGGSVGSLTPLGALSVSVSSNGFTASSIHATSITLTGSSSASFNGPLTTTGSSGINLTAHTVGINSGVGTITTTTGNGPMQIANAGGLSINNCTFNLGGAFQQTGAGAVTLIGAATTINTNTNSNSISFASAIDGTLAGGQALTLNSGSGGAITFSGAIGGTTRLGAILISSTAGTSSVHIGNNMTANSFTITNAVPLTLAGTSVIDTSAGGGAITFGGTIDGSTAGSQALTLTSGLTGAITFTGAVGGSTRLGAILISSTAGTSSVHIGTNITANSFVITNAVPTTLAGTSTIDTSINGGAITFGGTVNGAQALALTAGSGAVTLTGVVGATTALSSLTVNSAGAITINNIGAASAGVTGATSLPSTGALSFTGTVYRTTGSQSYTAGSGSNINVKAGATSNFTAANNPITFSTGTIRSSSNGAVLNISSGSGNINVSAIGAALNEFTTVSLTATGTETTTDAIFANTMTFAGPPTLIQVGGNITTKTALSFPVATQMTATAILTTTNTAISFTGTLNGANDLTLAAGTGAVTFSGIVGGLVPLTSLNATGNTITQNHAVTTTGALTYTATAALNGVILHDNITTGGGNITINGPVQLSATVALSTGLNTGNIQFSGTVDGTSAGAQSLSLNAGGGNIVFTGALGTTVRLGTLTVTNTNNFTANALTLAAFDQITGSGTTTFNGAVDINTVAGMQIANSRTIFNSTVNTTNGGIVNVSVSNLLTLSSSAAFTLTGAFTESGPVQSAGSIATASQLIQFGGSVVLTGATSLSTVASPGANIHFESTLDGPGALTLSAGTVGNINFDQSVGYATRLGGLTINSAASVTASAGIRAAWIDQVQAATSTYNSDIIDNNAIDTNALIPSTSSEVVLNGTTISISGNLFTSAGGAFTITNSGQLTLAAGSSTSLSGVFLQQGGGHVNLSGLISTTVITTNPAIYFTNPITLSGDATLTTPGAGTGSITLSSTVDGTLANTQSLTVSDNGGNIYLNGDIGDSFPLLNLIISQGASVTTYAITVSSLTQSSGSGVSTFNGAVTTSGSGISLTGTSFIFHNNVTTGGSGALSVIGALTFNSSALTPSYQIGGAFTQSGGAVSLTGPLTAGGAIQIYGALAVPALASGSLDTSAVNLPITLYSTVDGSGSLSLASGTGDIQINGIVGSTPGSLTIATAHNFTAQMPVTITALTQSSGTGLTEFEGNVNAGSGGINLTGVNFTFLQNVTSHSGGAISIDHTGTLTTTAGMAISANGIFTQTGSGIAANVQLAGTIQTTNSTAGNAAINFIGCPITLTAPVFVDSHIGGGTITFSVNSSVDSSALNHQPITLNAGSGDINIDSVFGATALGAFTITNAFDVTVQAINADSITQTAAVLGGTTYLLGSLMTDTNAGIQITGYNFTLGPAVISITTTNGGSLIVNNSGLIIGTPSTFPSPTITVSGSFSQIGSGTIVVAGLVTAYLGISFAGPVIVFEDSTLDSSAGSGGIAFHNTVDSCSGTSCPGPQNLTLIAGSGNISFADSVGGTNPLGVLTFQSAADINALNSLSTISAASITTNAPTPLTGLANFACTLSTSSSSGIVLNGNQFTFNNDITTIGSGNVTITNAGTFTIGNFADFVIDGAFQQNGAGAVFFDGTITTTNANPTIDAISFASPITLITPAIFDTSGGSGDNNITFAGTVDGASTLTMTAGNGNITFDSTIGLPTPLTGLTIDSAATVLLSQTASLSGPVAITATGPMTFGGSLSASAITLNGTAITFDNSVTASSGNISITNSALLTTATGISSGGIFTQTGAGAVNLAGTIQTTSAISAHAAINFSGTGAISLTGPVLIDSHIGGGTITFEHSPTSGSSTVDGHQPITLNAGAGDINIYSVFGGVHALGAVTFTMAHNITVQAITADSITQIGATATGTSSLLGNLIANTGAGISLTGANFSSSGSITTIVGSNGALTINNSGTVSGTGASTITLDGAFTQTAVGTNSLVDLGGTITLTSPATVSFASPVDVLLPTTITSDNGNITFYNTVDGPACLTLVAGSGSITFDGIVGGTTPLGCLIISSANMVLQNSSLATSGYVHETATAIRLYGNITTNEAASILTNEITLTGNVSIGGASVTLSNNGGSGNISISGTTDSLNGNNNLAIQANSGNITLSQPIGAMTSFNNLTFSANTISWANLGSTSQGAIGTTQLNATTNINFNGTTYNGYTQDYTSASGSNLIFNNGGSSSTLTTITSGGGSITFTTGTILLSNYMSISSSGGAVAMTDLLTTSPNLINFTLLASTGNFTFTQIGSPTDYLNTVHLTAGIFFPAPNPGTNVYALSGSYIVLTPQHLSGSICLIAPTIYAQPIILDGNVTITCAGTCSGSSGGTITFNETVNARPSGGSLTIDFYPSCIPACTGSVIFKAPVGSTTPLPTSLNIDSAIDVTAADYSINVGSLSITNASGTTTINGLSTGSGGATIQSPIVNLQGNINGSGPFTADMGLSTSSALNMAAGTIINVAGPFQQIGSGAVAIGGSVTTQNEKIVFNGPITLVNDTIFQSNGVTNGDISFASPNATINGGFDLVIDAGSSNVYFNETVGQLTGPLTSLQINNAGNVTASASIFANSIKQLAGSGSYDALTASGSNGIQLSGHAFTLNGNISTGGALSIANSALLTFANALSTYVAGALTQTGAGSIQMAGTFSLTGAVSLSSGVELIGATSFDTHTTNQNISFTSALTDNGSHNNLTLNTGTGSITSSNLGTLAVPIGALTITHAGTVQTGSIYAASITTTNPFTAAATFGNLTTNGGMTLSGTGLTIGAITTGGASSCSITNTGPLSLTLGTSSSVAGAFTQSGGGAVSLTGTLAAGQGISFANAMTLPGSASFSTTALDITLTNSVTGQNGTQSLTLSAARDINFGGTLSSLDALTITTVRNITYPQVNANLIEQLASTGTTTISGALTTSGMGTDSGVSISGGVINQNGAITTHNGGPVTLTNTNLLTVGIGVTTNASGPYTQSGVGGTVSLGGSINATNSSISIADATTLTNDIILNAGPTSSVGISFGSTIQGAHALTLLAPGTGTGGVITLSGDVGTNATALTGFTITNAHSVTTQGIYSAFIQATGIGTSATFNGVMSTSSGITLNGNSFNVNSPFSTTAGSVTITNSGALVFAVGATGSIAGSFTQNNASGTTQLANSIIIQSGGGAVRFYGPVTVAALAVGSIDTHLANQPITFSSTVDGSGGLTLNSGSGTITLNTVGSTPLSAFTITNAGNVTAGSISAGSIIQNGGSGTTQTNSLSTTTNSGISLQNDAIHINGSLNTTNGGPVVINHTIAASSLVLGISAASISGSFTEEGTGTVSLAGNLTTTNGAITFNNAISLTNTTTLASGGGNIQLVTVDGGWDFTIIAGAGSITSGDIGDSSPHLKSLTIQSADTVTLQAISAGYIVQSGAIVGGLTTFNGAIATTGNTGLNLTGYRFTFAPTSSVTNGPVQIANSNLLTINTPFNLAAGYFSQSGSGNVSLNANITTAGTAITFTGPVSVDHDIALSTSGGNIIFNNTVGGSHSLTLDAGSSGMIAFDQNVGTNSLSIGALTVNNADTFTAPSIYAASIDLSGITTSATISGSLYTSGAIMMAGGAFTIDGNVSTTSGSFTINNLNSLVFGPNSTFSLGGLFWQNGSGSVSGGGTISTQNDTITFVSEVTLTGDLSINSNGADVSLYEVIGPYNLTITAGAGNISCSGVIGQPNPLMSFLVTSAFDIALNGVGSATTGITGPLNLIASDNISLSNTIYAANSQHFNAANDVDFSDNPQTNLTSFGGPISFTTGIVLGSNNDLYVITNGGSFSFNVLEGTDNENITINTSGGTAALGTVNTLHPGTINILTVTAGKIIFGGPIDPTNTTFISDTDIMNAVGPVLITGGNMSFNALGGNVGSIGSPILIQSTNQVFAGANGPAPSLADFRGISFENTIYPIPTNPPCEIIFNDLIIKNCTIPPVPPTPSVPTGRIFPGVGFDSSFFNLASDFYFLNFFIDETYVKRDVAIYYRAPKNP